MSRIRIGIIDYGIGNHSSVKNVLRRVGYNATISSSREQLDLTDVLLLPGVGAFPHAMQRLNSQGMAEYLRHAACLGRPIIGICLGMQLLFDQSDEIETTAGLGLIPGEIKQIKGVDWHIGWNSIRLTSQLSLLSSLENASMYFNHSHSYQGSQSYVVAESFLSPNKDSIPAIVAKGNVIGIQFHPEKSQRAGARLLSFLIDKVTERC